MTVDYATANGTGSAGSDYTATSGKLAFAPGQTTQTMVVTIQGDTLTEGPETFFVNLSNPANATFNEAQSGSNQATGTILDANGPTTISISDIAVNEGTGDTQNAVFKVTLSAPSAQTIGVTCGTSDGTARTPSDYAASRVNLSFAPGETSKTFTVPIITDSTDENNEVFYGLLINPVNAGLAKGRGSCTISDNDVCAFHPYRRVKHRRRKSNTRQSQPAHGSFSPASFCAQRQIG